MNFLQHSYILKNYLFLIIYSWFLQLIIYYYYFDSILFFLVSPLLTLTNTTEFITSDLMDFFILKFYITFFFSTITTLFVVFFFILKFIQPGLYKTNILQNYIYYSMVCFGFVINSVIFFKILVPQIWKFFLSFQDLTLMESTTVCIFEPNLINYVFLILKLFLGINLCLYCIFIIFLIGVFHFIDIRNISNNRRIFYWLIVFGTTLFTVDILTQSFALISLICIFEILIFNKYVFLEIFR